MLSQFESKYSGEREGDLAAMFVVGTIGAVVGIASTMVWFWGLVLNDMVPASIIILALQMIVIVVFTLALWERIRWVRIPPVARVALGSIALPGAMWLIGCLVGAVVKGLQSLR